MRKIINNTRATLRFILLAIWSISYLVLLIIVAVISKLTLRNNKARMALAHSFFNSFIRGLHIIAGIRLHWHGKSPKKAHVIMGNHRSYVDAVVLPVSFPAVFVARHETKSWPLIGIGATLLGTIWVMRDKKESRRATRVAVKERLEDGLGVIIFPEGTTGPGPDLLPFHKGMFYTCAENGFPIAPVAIEFENDDLNWVNKEWFIPHAFRNFGNRRNNIHVSFGPSFSGNDAEKLLDDVRNWTQNESYRLRDLVKK